VTGLTYNQANRLATASSGAGVLAQYTYDGFGQRVVKLGSITATTLYQYDHAGHLLEENDGAGNTRVDYVYLDERPVATIQPTTGKVYFLHDDTLGTPQLATDAGQFVQWAATYQPFGYTSTGVGLIVQNLRLPGHEFDLETGIYHNGFRDYAQSLGRYLESDPIGLSGGPNAYGYAGENPVKFVDPLGLNKQFFVSMGGTVAALPFGVGASISLGVSTPDSLWDISGYQIFLSPALNEMLGMGFYFGWGATGGTTHSNGPLPWLSGQVNPYAEADVALVESASRSIQFERNFLDCRDKNTGRGSSVSLPRVGTGLGFWGGYGFTASATIATPTLGQIFSFGSMLLQYQSLLLKRVLFMQ
jgi:RHS repeat-associated protein